MSVYIAYIKKAFQRNMVYKLDYLLGILNTCLQIFISCAIWKVLYGGKSEVDGITYTMVVTNFIIGQGLANAYGFNDSAVQRKLNDGSICNELLKPISFRGYLFADNLGNIIFKLVSNFVPSLIIAAVFIGMQPPQGIGTIFYFSISVVLGFLVLWMMSSIVQMSAFWIMNVWSLSTIKNVFVNILSGSALPLWFMPDFVKNIMKYTPFDSIYFVPVRIYLGELVGTDILYYYGRQIFWILILYGIGTVLWLCGSRKVVLQGG